MQVIRESIYHNGVWSDWEVMQRAPPHLPTLRQIYDSLLQEYNRNPRTAVRIYTQGIQAVRILTIPDGRSSPFWWTDDGLSFNALYEFWAVMP
jgi:hypothetical protein